MVLSFPRQSRLYVCTSQPVTNVHHAHVTKHNTRYEWADRSLLLNSECVSGTGETPLNDDRGLAPLPQRSSDEGTSVIWEGGKNDAIRRCCIEKLKVDLSFPRQSLYVICM